MKVILTGFSGDVGQALLKRYTDRGDNVLCFDPRKDNPKDLKADVLIISHGLVELSASKEVTFESNTFSVARLLEMAVTIVGEEGCVIVISSRRGVRPRLEEWDYSAAKAATIAYTQALYKAYPRLRITALCPGWIEGKWAAKQSAQNVISLDNLVSTCCLLSDSTSFRCPILALEPVGLNEL